MDKDQGWIKIHRKSEDDPLYFAEPFDKWHAWEDLIHLAAHKDREFYLRGIKVKQKRGQVAESVDALCRRWRWSDGKVKRFIKYLQDDGKITLQKSSVINRMSIVNYERYQGGDPTNNPTNNLTNNPTNNQTNSPTNDPTYNNVKNEKNINLVESKDSMSEQVPTSQSESINFDNLVTNFNNITHGVFGKVKLPLSENRKKQIRARIREHGKEDFMQVIKMSVQSPFLRGQNDRSWSMTFDWMIKPTNFEKILSGNYNQVEPRVSKPGNGKTNPKDAFEEFANKMKDMYHGDNQGQEGERMLGN